jgi:GDP-L-fucose synthase
MDFFAGWVERMAEFQIQTHKIRYGIENYFVVRWCNVYGPGDNFDPNNAMVIQSLMYRIFGSDDRVVINGSRRLLLYFACIDRNNRGMR